MTELELHPVQGTTRIEIDSGVAEIGRMQLWVPEAICSNTGNSAVYPLGAWTVVEEGLEQFVDRDSTVGPGNCPKIDESTFECNGIRTPADGPVEWSTVVSAENGLLRFRIQLQNVGDRPILKAGAAVCFKFLDADWWSDDSTYVLSGGLTTLAELGRKAGLDNGFQAYLVNGETYDHRFYREFWGFNERRLDRPVMVSEMNGSVCVGIESRRAYFLHSNRGNPCTDIQLALGDVEPGGSAEAEGEIWLKEGRALDLLSK